MNGTPTIAPTLVLTVSLEAQQWNQVMAAIAEAPFRIAAPLMQAIGEQVNQQAAAAPQPVVNGAAHQERSL